MSNKIKALLGAVLAAVLIGAWGTVAWAGHDAPARSAVPGQIAGRP